MRSALVPSRRRFLLHSGLGALALALGCKPDEQGKDSSDTGSGGETGDTGSPSGETADTGETAETAETGEAADPWGEAPTDCSTPTAQTGTGPFYREGMPERTNLNPLDEAGTPIRMYFRVFDQRCTPLAGALVEVWHCAPEAEYDMESTDYRFYGSQYTDSEGRGFVESIRPPIYFDDAGEHAPHVHFQITLDGYKVIATQVQFEADDDESGLYPVVAEELDADGFYATLFTIVLEPNEPPPA